MKPEMEIEFFPVGPRHSKLRFYPQSNRVYYSIYELPFTVENFEVQFLGYGDKRGREKEEAEFIVKLLYEIREFYKINKSEKESNNGTN